MRLSEGVEWALHSCLVLAWLGRDRRVPAANIAAAHALPPAYLNKQLQALVRGCIVTSVAGARGGFQLARDPEEITLMDVVAAIEGTQEAFRCTEIRQRGLGSQAPAHHFRTPCAIHEAMRSAELAWRRRLAAQTLADLLAATEKDAPGVSRRVTDWYERALP